MDANSEPVPPLPIPAPVRAKDRTHLSRYGRFGGGRAEGYPQPSFWKPLIQPASPCSFPHQDLDT